MKAWVLLLSVSLLFSQQQVQADMLGLTVQADVANVSLGGRGGDHLATQPLQFSDDHWKSLSIAFEHPLPLVPNVALRLQDGQWTGQTLLSAPLKLNEQVYAAQSLVSNKFDIKTTELDLYYEIVDTSLLALDLGASVMRYENDLAVTMPNSQLQRASGFLPLLYGHVTVHVFGTDTKIFLHGLYGDYRNQQWSQTKVGVAYDFVDLTALTVAVKVGWLDQSMALVNQDKLDTDFQQKGAFVALEVDF
jgi:outer membrane protein